MKHEMNRIKKLSRIGLVIFLGALWITACGDDVQTLPQFDTGPTTVDMGAADSGVDAITPDQQPPAPTHQIEVEELVQPIMDGQWTVGLVVGLLTPQSTEYYFFGSVEEGGSPPDEHTLFEIGSVTKTFTSLALARMVEAGIVTLEQPVQDLLPLAEVQMPQRNSKQISLLHLSTHTSGLPRLPTNFDSTNEIDPYHDYTSAQLYSFLNDYTLPRDPGEVWEYSNLAVGLLGHALSLKAGSSFEALIADQITTPLGLMDTVILTSAEQDERFARGYNYNLEPTLAWNFEVLAPAGALRSTAADMLAYLAAQLGYSETPLDSAIALTHQLHYDGDDKMGLAWNIQDSRYLWHNGVTLGCETFVGMDPLTQTAVVVLSNAYSVYVPQTRLGLALLQMMAGQPYEPVDLPPTVEVPPETLAQYVGTYQKIGAGIEPIVTLTNDNLYITWGEQPQYRLFAQTVEQFYLRALQIDITFAKDGTGQYNDLVFATKDGSSTFIRVP